jgi:serine/threonine protein kinase
MRCRHKNIYDMRSALRWAGQIASALSALHEQQPPYVHNDVKADNVFLTDAPRFLDVEDAKLGDLKPHRWELSKRG